MDSNTPPTPLVIPNLVDVGFDLADRIAPHLEKMRQTSHDPINRRLDTALLVSGSFIFAGTLVAKFCEEFIKALASEAAKKIMVRLPGKSLQKPNEVAQVLGQLNVNIENLHLTCAGPRDLQQAIDRAVASVRDNLAKDGVPESDARRLAASLAETIGAKIKI